MSKGVELDKLISEFDDGIIRLGVNVWSFKEVYDYMIFELQFNTRFYTNKIRECRDSEAPPYEKEAAEMIYWKYIEVNRKAREIIRRSYNEGSPLPNEMWHYVIGTVIEDNTVVRDNMHDESIDDRNYYYEKSEKLKAYNKHILDNLGICLNAIKNRDKKAYSKSMTELEFMWLHQKEFDDYVRGTQYSEYELDPLNNTPIVL